MRRAWLVLPFLLLGCGGGDSTGPSTAEVGGSWRFSWSNLSGSGVSCNASGDFQLTQSGTTFSGVQYGTGTIICLAGGESLTDLIVGETLAAGQVNGSAVSFRIGSVQSTHSGTVSGGSMSGTATWTFDLGDGLVVNLAGQWTAVRL